MTGPVLPDETVLHVRALLPPPWDELAPLIAESEAEGFRHLARLRDEYAGRPGHAPAGAARPLEEHHARDAWRVRQAFGIL